MLDGSTMYRLQVGKVTFNMFLPKSDCRQVVVYQKAILLHVKRVYYCTDWLNISLFVM